MKWTYISGVVLSLSLSHSTFANQTMNDTNINAQGDALSWYQQGIEAKYRLKDAIAIESFEKAANQGHIESQYELAMLLLNQELNQGKAHDKSLHWLTSAAHGDHPIAQYELALFYMDEYDNPESEALVAQWMGAAAGNDHPKAKTWVSKQSE